MIAAHGGCGASTLVHFLGGGAEEAEVDQAGQLVGRGVGVGRDCAGIGATRLSQWQRRPVVVVGQATAYGVARVGGLGGLLVEHGLFVIAVVVSDGPLREPVAVRARLRAMRGWATAIVRVPYVTRWRFIDQATEPPGAYLAAVEQVRAALGQGGSGFGRDSNQSSSGRGRRSQRKDQT